MPVYPSPILRLLFASCLVGAGLCAAVLPPYEARGLTIDVRLMCASTGGCSAGDFFFDHPEALSALKFAAKAYEPFADQLAAIPASPGWTATFTNPDTGLTGSTISNLSVPANTLILYAGGYDMPGGQVGEAGPGSANMSFNRGQGSVAGPSAQDFAPWGGSIAFDTLDNGVPRNWHFGTFTQPAPGQVDFLTIAFHELAHVFGFGTAASFDNLVTAHQFQGVRVISLTGTTVPLTSDDNHWADGTTSPPYANQPSSALTSVLLLGRRNVLTPLDYAMLADIGWQVPSKLYGLQADMDGDGDVDGRDFLVWQRDFGKSGLNMPGDANGDNKVDDFDLWLWYQNHGARLTAGSFLADLQVPEPTAWVLSLMALLAASGSRRY